MFDRAVSTAPGMATVVPPRSVQRVLDPVSRASELLFGLIMVLTFTLSLAHVAADHADVKEVLIGVLGCNLAWAIIDAILYLMGVHGERLLAISVAQTIRDAESDAGRAIVADHLPPIILPALTESDLERIRLYLRTLAPETLRSNFGREDYLAASGVFLLVFLCLFPVAAPFLFINEITLALRLSNAVALIMLFLTGFAFGRQVGRPYRAGFMMVAIGIALVAVAMALGG